MSENYKKQGAVVWANGQKEKTNYSGIFRLIAIVLFLGLVLGVCIYLTAPSD
jgi:hypothetical protein